MTTLIRPDNKQPATVMRISSGRIALDTTCITPSVRWWTLGELEAVNDRASVAAACKTPELEPVLGCTEPPPMCIYPMPAVYPQAVWLAAANYYLHSQVIHLDPIAVVKSAKMIAKAG